MANKTICLTIEGEVCHRHSPSADGLLCLRCGHNQGCHNEQRLCWYRRDDKTAATCAEKFKNLRDKDFVLPPEVVENVENFKRTIVERRTGLNERFQEQLAEIERSRPLHPQMMRNDRLSSKGERLEDHERDDNCARLGCYPVPSDAFLNAEIAAGANRMLREMGYNDLEFVPMPDEPAMTQTLPFENPLAPLFHMDIAKMRAGLYEAMRKLESDKDLEGFTLARVYVRPGEFTRLVGNLYRYPQENPPKMESGQVGLMWLDAASAMVPVFESAFLPETMTTKKSAGWPQPQDEERRVICMLQYERKREFADGAARAFANRVFLL